MTLNGRTQWQDQLQSSETVHCSSSTSRAETERVHASGEDAKREPNEDDKINGKGMDGLGR
eukprot:3955274-Amphidinium_carterae.1